jgi:hypothetical protein
MVLVRPTTHHYVLKDNALNIDFRNGCYGFDAEIYILSGVDWNNSNSYKQLQNIIKTGVISGL